MLIAATVHLACLALLLELVARAPAREPQPVSFGP